MKIEVCSIGVSIRCIVIEELLGPLGMALSGESYPPIAVQGEGPSIKALSLCTDKRPS